MTHDLVVIGGGPAALLAALACSERGLDVGLVLGTEREWVPTYGGWTDELRALGWGDLLAEVWPETCVWLGEDRRIDLGRSYARVDGTAARAHLLERLHARGVRPLVGQATAVRHDAAGSTVEVGDALLLRTRLVVDATGHQPRFVKREGEPTSFQAAVGQAWRGWKHPWDPDTMVFMDLRAGPGTTASSAPTFLYVLPSGPDEVFVEETSLVRGPAVPFDELRARLEARLAPLDVGEGEVRSTELCLIPMDAPLPDLNQRTVGFGGAASMVHPATGYTLARAIATAPDLAEAVHRGIVSGLGPDALARTVWRAVWSEEDLLRRELHLYGSSILQTLDAAQQQDFFAAFFSMPSAHWTSYLAGRGEVSGVVRAMASMMMHAGFRIRWKLIRSGTKLPALLLRRVG